MADNDAKGDSVEGLEKGLEKLQVGKRWGDIGEDEEIAPPNFDAAKPADAKPAAASSATEPAARGTTSKQEYGEIGDAVDSAIDLELLQAEVEVQQGDPTSPLYSVGNFEEMGLKSELLRALTDMGYKKPSSIQENALPLILKNPPENVIGQAQSGTGKTATFSLGMLMRVDPTVHHPQAVCVCPSRELAVQISDVVRQLAKYTDVKVVSVLAQQKYDNIRAQIVVGTPGKVQALCVPKRLKGGRRSRPIIDMKKIKMLVLDEADSMVAGHRQKCIELKGECGPNVQFLCFSATFEEDIQEFMEEFVPAPRNKIMVKKKDVAIDRVRQFFVVCQNEEARYQVLTTLYKYITVGQCMIFVDMKRRADELTARMRRDLLTVELLHGDLDAKQRDVIMEKFRRNEIRILITTDVLARGIDVPQVSLVINYDLPHTRDMKPDKETYIHRIGRTGRYGKPGVAINFVHNQETMRILEYIRTEIQREINEISESNLERVSEELNSLFKKTKKKKKVLLEEEDDDAAASSATSAAAPS